MSQPHATHRRPRSAKHARPGRAGKPRRNASAPLVTPPAPPQLRAAILRLSEILPGGWQVCIQTPFALGKLQIVFTHQGTFRGELLTAAGPFLLDGQWQADDASRRISLEGRQADETRVMPYRASVHVTFFDTQQIVGTTPEGDQTTWHKQTPAA
mgnify:CR=1 FL=1